MERSAKAKQPPNHAIKSKASVACQTEGIYLGRGSGGSMADDDVILHDDIDAAVIKRHGGDLSSAVAAMAAANAAAAAAAGVPHLFGVQPPPPSQQLQQGGGQQQQQQQQQTNPNAVVQQQPPSATPPTATQQQQQAAAAVATVIEPSTSATASSKGGKVDENTLRVTISGFSKMTDTLCSEPKRIGDVPWRIMVMPKQHMVQKKSQKCMGFFLQCCPDNTYSDQWSCHAVAEMRLISERPNVQNFVRKTTHVYTAKENDWGYSCFMTWADVLEENQGYIKNDSVTLEISVKADPPKNMMTREEFRKTLDQWYNLAELQMSRGQVDLALEANGQALKYCKDKDDEYKEKLEAQKENLVKKKLIESINRIEQGKDPSRPADAATCPTSLRQALTGAQKSIVGAKVTDKRHTNGTAKKERRGAAVAKQMRKKVEANRSDKQQQRKSDESSPPGEETKTPSPPVGDKPASTPPIDYTDKKLTKFAEAIEKAAAEKVGEEKFPNPAACPLVKVYNEVKAQERKMRQDEARKMAQDEMLNNTAEGTSESDSSEYAEDAGVTRNDCEDRQSMTSAEDGDDGAEDEEEDEEDEEDGDGCGPEIDCDEMVETADGVTQTEDTIAPTVSMEFLSAMAAAGGGLPMDAHRGAGGIASQAAAANAYLASGGDQLAQVARLCDLLKQHNEANLPEVTAAWMEYGGRLPETMMATFKNSLNARPLTSPTAQMGSASFDYAPADPMTFADVDLSLLRRKTHLREGDTEEIRKMVKQNDQMNELVSLGMSCLNAQRFLSRLDELFKCLEMILKMDLVQSALQKVFANKTYATAKRQTVAKSTVAAACASSFTHTATTNMLMKEMLAVGSSPTYGSDEEEDSCNANATGDDGQDASGQSQVESAAAADNRGVPGPDTGDSNEEETLHLLKTLFGRELLAYNHQMTGLMERLEEIYNSSEMVRVALDSKEAKKLIETSKKNEQRIAELEAKNKQLNAELNREREAKKRAESEKQVATERADEERAKADAIAQQLKEKRNELRKLEKKQRQDENRVTELVTEVSELEEKMKGIKKEVDNAKKKATEERSKMRKEKEKDTETIRRLESEVAEKEAEKERERAAAEERAREWKHKEQNGVKERKHLQTTIASLTDRAKRAEIAQLDVELAAGLKILERARDDCTQHDSDLEEAIKKFSAMRISHSEVDAARKSQAEWRAVREELVASIAKTKADYVAHIEQIKSGAKSLAQLPKLMMPRPPPAPKILTLAMTSPPQATNCHTPSSTGAIPTSTSSSGASGQASAGGGGGAGAGAPPLTPTGRGPAGGVGGMNTPSSSILGGGPSVSNSTVGGVGGVSGGGGATPSHLQQQQQSMPPTPSAGVIGQPRTPQQQPMHPQQMQQQQSAAARDLQHLFHHASPVRPMTASPSSAMQSPASFSRAPSPPQESPAKLLPIGVRPPNHVNHIVTSSTSSSSNSQQGPPMAQQHPSSMYGGGVGNSPASGHMRNASDSAAAAAAAAVAAASSSPWSWNPISNLGEIVGLQSSGVGGGGGGAGNGGGVNGGANSGSSCHPAPGASRFGAIGAPPSGASNPTGAILRPSSTAFSPYEHGLAHEMATQLSWQSEYHQMARAAAAAAAAGGQPPPGWSPAWAQAPGGVGGGHPNQAPPPQPPGTNGTQNQGPPQSSYKSFS